MAITKKEKVMLSILEALISALPNLMTKEKLKPYINDVLFDEAFTFLDDRGYIQPIGWEHTPVEQFTITEKGKSYRVELDDMLSKEIKLNLMNKPKKISKEGIFMITLLILINWDKLWQSINERAEEISSVGTDIINSITDFINSLDPLLTIILFGFAFWYFFIREK